MMGESPGRVEIRWDEFASEALVGNALGDPTTRTLPVLLPPGYEDDPGRRYPTLYGLAGFTGRGASMLNVEPWQPTLAGRLERLYAAGMPPVIVVLPDCFTRLGGSQYLNSPATGRYEDYLTREIVPYVDAHYRTVASAAGRGVFGKSSGGYGALIMAMRHADLFSAIACHSGDSYFDLCYRPDFPGAALAIAGAGGLQAWFQAFESREKKSGADHAALNIVAMAACYSPAAGAPLGLDLPFDLYTCALREDVWARWLAWDPVRMVPRYTDALGSLRLLFIDCGARDEFNLQFGARLLTAVLREHDIAYDYEEFDDDHRSISYRYDISLPRLAAALHGQE
jgi:S-formylglutathione hydrolase FrmB